MGWWVCVVDFNVEVDFLFVVAYGVLVCEVDLNEEVDGLFVVTYVGWLSVVWILVWL